VGTEGLRDFLAAREGFFDERYEVKEVLDVELSTPDEAG
jgi:hypothetical protein